MVTVQFTSTEVDAIKELIDYYNITANSLLHQRGGKLKQDDIMALNSLQNILKGIKQKIENI